MAKFGKRAQAILDSMDSEFFAAITDEQIAVMLGDWRAGRYDVEGQDPAKLKLKPYFEAFKEKFIQKLERELERRQVSAGN